MPIEKRTVGRATLYRADCLDLLEFLPQFDAVITDPPYGLGCIVRPFKYQRAGGLTPESWDNARVTGLQALLELGEVRVVWGGNYYADQLPASRGWLAWFKPDAPPSMSSVELAWTNRDQNARHLSHSIAATNATGERCGHPTQKPVAVMRWTLAAVGAPLRVLDPFMGAGSTGVAVIEAGGEFTGIEIEPRYFELACERLENVQRQERLFA